ncbi:MAG: hypothetical protein KAW12_21595 [Candidatus Aminicenantes bacterium]|nr:hypothetical protein [Candidatus Aminicenantes bacterium]
MTAKKLLLLIVVVFTLSLFLQAEKKDPPIPLAELQNPKSPSYVPIPYPKTREEIITDVKYMIEKFYVTREGMRSYGEPNRGLTLFPKLLGNNPELYVGKIVPVTSKTTSRAKRYFVMDIHDRSGTVVARMCFEDSGIWAASGFATGRFPMSPLMSIEDVKKRFAEHSNPELAGLKVESIEYERYIAHSAVNPVLRINTLNEVFYMDIKYNVYRIQKKEKFSSLRELDFKHSRVYRIRSVPRSFNILLIDNLKNEAAYLIKVK